MRRRNDWSIGKTGVSGIGCKGSKGCRGSISLASSASSASSTSSLRGCQQFLLFLHDLFDAADQVERLLGDRIVFAFRDLGKPPDGVLELDVFALQAGELLGHEEGLGEEPLHLAGPRYGQLVVFR